MNPSFSSPIALPPASQVPSGPHRPGEPRAHRHRRRRLSRHPAEAPGAAHARGGGLQGDSAPGKQGKLNFLQGGKQLKLSCVHAGDLLARGQAALPADRRGVPLVRVPQVLQLRQRHQEVRGQERLHARKVTHAHLRRHAQGGEPKGQIKGNIISNITNVLQFTPEERSSQL